MSHQRFDTARQAAKTRATTALLAAAAQYFDPADDIETTLGKIETIARYLFDADPRGFRPTLGDKEAAATYVGWAWGVAQSCHRER